MAKTTKYDHKRTGLRKPLNFLKSWGGKRRLTPQLSVAMVDEALDTANQGGRKSWYLALIQDGDLLEKLGPVRYLPKGGKTLLLFEDDLVALVEYLLDVAALVDVDEEGAIVNESARAWELTGGPRFDEGVTASGRPRKPRTAKKTPVKRTAPKKR